MFRKILVATDLGEASKEAFMAAEQMAREQNAELHVLHVVIDLASEPWIVEAYGVDFGALMTDACAAARQNLAVRVSRITPPLANVRAEVLVGKPASEILRYAAEAAIDLIVLGSHGRGPVGRAFLGSVADRVLREARCPVLIVRPAAAACAVCDAA